MIISQQSLFSKKIISIDEIPLNRLESKQSQNSERTSRKKLQNNLLRLSKNSSRLYRVKDNDSYSQNSQLNKTENNISVKKTHDYDYKLLEKSFDQNSSKRKDIN